VGRAEMRWEKMLTCGSYRQNGVTVLGEVDNSGSRVKKPSTMVHRSFLKFQWYVGEEELL
jgi:hypothetical protein